MKIETIHGTLVVINGVGVLIRGASGTGKSDTALQLVSRGHKLVADDAVVIETVGDRLVGSSFSRMTGLLNIRGLGICDLKEMFGESAVQASCGIDLCIELVEGNGGSPKRLDHFLDAEVPGVTFENCRSRSIPILIETAARFIKTEGRSIERAFLEEYDQAVAS